MKLIARILAWFGLELRKTETRDPYHEALMVRGDPDFIHRNPENGEVSPAGYAQLETVERVMEYTLLLRECFPDVTVAQFTSQASLLWFGLDEGHKDVG